MFSGSNLLRILGLCIMLCSIIALLYFVIYQFSVFLNIPLNTKTILFIIGGLIIFMIATRYLGEMHIPGGDELSTISVMILYILILMFPLIAILYVINHFFALPHSILIGISIVWLGLGIYFGNVIKFTPLVIENTGLDREVKIVFISDIHLDKIRSTKYARHIVNTIKKVNPDLVLIGGDLLNGANTDYVKGFLPFNDLNIPVYAIMGNHDHMGDPQAAPLLFQETSIIPLINQSIIRNGIQLIGLEDKSMWKGQSITDMLDISNIQSGAQYTILLSHQPQKLNKFKDYPIDLTLNGHTHRGQIIPFSWLIGFFNDYAYGRYDQDGKTAFVSQGIGGWGGPLRMGTQSEMVVITLKP